MRISVILAFLLSWNFVSSNPHQETSNDKSVGELNHENDGGSGGSSLARAKSSDDASSGKDRGGDTLKETDPDDTDENHDEEDQPFLLTLISEGLKAGTKFMDEIFAGTKKKTGTSKNESSGRKDSSDDGNIFSWIQENVEAFTKLFGIQNHKKDESSVEKAEKHGGRAKRDLGISGSLRSKPYRASVSEELLKLSEGSGGNVLKSKKASMAEALNGRAIRRILERAKARAAKVVPHKDLYDINDFGKWLVSGVSFNTDIFNHLDSRLSPKTKGEEHSTGGSTDRDSHRHREGKQKFSTLSNSAADTDNSREKLLHKSEDRERLSPELQITSEEKNGRDEIDWMFREPTKLSRYRSLSYDDDTEDGIGLRYYSHPYAPRMPFWMDEVDEDPENDMSKTWKRAEWVRPADPFEFDFLEDLDDYEDGKLAANSQGETKLGRNRYYYGDEDRERSVRDEKNRYFGDFLDKRASSVDLHRRKNIRSKNKHLRYDTVQTISPTGEHNNYGNYGPREKEGIDDDAESTAGVTSPVGSEHRYDLLRPASSDDSREKGYVGTRMERVDPNGGHRTTGRRRTSIEPTGFPDLSDEERVFMPEFPLYEFWKGHGPRYVDYDYYDPDQGSDIGGFRGNNINYDDLNEEDFAGDDEETRRLIWAIFNSHRDKWSDSQHVKHSEHSQRARYNVYTFEEFLHNITWSSEISEYEIWQKYIQYLYYIWKLQRGEFGESFQAFVNEHSKKQDNAMNKEVLLDRRGRKHTTDEDNKIHLQKHKKWPQSEENFTVKKALGSTKNNVNNERISNEEYGERRMRINEINEENLSNQNGNHETRLQDEIRQDSTRNIMSNAHRSQKIINNNNHHRWNSWNSMSLENSYADPRTEAYDSRRRSENVDINVEQAAETAESSSSESNRHVSTNKSSKSQSYTESQMDEHAVDKSNNMKKMTKGMHDWEKKKRIDQKNDVDMKRLMEKVSWNSETGKSRSNVRNKIDTSKLYTESRGRSEHWENLKDSKEHDKIQNTRMSTNTMSMENKQESLSLENESLFSKSSVQSKTEIENNSRENTRDIQTSDSDSELASTTSSKSLQEETDRTRDNFKSMQMNANAKALSTATLSNNIRESNHHLTNRNGNRISAISRTSNESTLSNTAEDERKSHLRQSSRSSSSTSSEKTHEKSRYDSNNIQNRQMNVATAESSATSRSLNNAEGENSFDSSKSSSWKSLKKKYQRNSNDAIQTQENNIKHQSELESTSSSESHATSTLIDTNNDKRRRKGNTLKAAWFIDPKIKNKMSAKDEIIREEETMKKSSVNALSSTTSETANFANTRDTQNSIVSSSIDSKGTAKTYNENSNQLKEDELIDNFAMSKISSTSRASNKNNDKNESLKESSLSESHSSLTEESDRNADTVQNSQGSMAMTKASSESTVSSDNAESRRESTKQSTLFESSEEARRKQKSYNIRREKYKDLTSGATFSNVNNKHRDNALKGASSAVLHKELQADDELRAAANTKDFIEALKFAILRKNNRSKHILPYNYRGKEGTETEIDPRGTVKYTDANDVSDAISRGKKTSTTSDNEERNNFREIMSSGNLHAKSSREDKDKSDIHSAADGTAATGITSYGDKQAHRDTLRKLIFLSNPSDEAQMRHGGNYDIPEKLPTVNGHNKLRAANLQKIILSHGLRTRDGNVESAARAKKNIKNAFMSTGDVNIEDEHEDDPIATFVANNRDKDRREFGSVVRYGDYSTADTRDAVKAKTSAETSISDVSSIERRSNAKKVASAISQLKRHDWNVRRGDRIASETESNGMQNARQLSLSGTSSNSRTEVQRGEIGDIGEEGSEVTAASAATSAQTASSGTVESGSREKLIGFSSRSDSYAESQREGKHTLDAASREEQVIVSAEASADSEASGNPESDWRTDSLYDPGRYTSARTKSVAKEQRENGVTTLLSNPRAEVKLERSGTRGESIETTSSSDTEDRVVKSKKIVNGAQINPKTAAYTVTSGEATSSSGIQDSSKILSSAGSHVESRADNRRTLNTGRNGKKAGSGEEAKLSATTLATTSIDERGERTDNFARGKSKEDLRVRKTTRTGNNEDLWRRDPRDSENIATSGRATSFSDVKNELREKNERESRFLPGRRLITADSTASSTSKTFNHADGSWQKNLDELTATSSSDSYAKSDARYIHRGDVLAKDHGDVLGASTSARATDNKFGDVGEGSWKSLRTTSSSDANARSVRENFHGVREVSNAAANAKTRTATSSDIVDADLRGLFDLLTGVTTRTRAGGEAISQEGVIKGDPSGTRSDVFSEARVASAKILGGNYENSAAVNAIAEMRDQRWDSHGRAASSSLADGVRDGQLDVTKSTSSADSRARSASEGISEGEETEADPRVNISTLRAAKAHNQVKGVHPSGWLVTTSDAGTLAEERAQNKDKFNVLREVGEVAVYAGAAAGDAGNIERSATRDEEQSETRDGLNAVTKIRDAISSAAARTITSMGAKSESESGRSVSSDEVTALDRANAERRVKIAGKSNVSWNSKSAADIEEEQSSTASAASSVSMHRFSGDLDTNDRARYRRIGNGMSATSANGMHLSSEETTALHPSREISKCDENVETGEFISEATSLYQTLDKQRGSEILLMKKNPRGPVQIASFKNGVPPLIAYRLIPREVYERIRAIIANKQIFCADCALSSSI